MPAIRRPLRKRGTTVALWWELAIPAVSALSGSTLGAWWQGRSGERQLRLSTEATERATRQAAEREDTRRFVAERRVAYVQLAGLVNDLLDRLADTADQQRTAAALDAGDQDALASAELAVTSSRAAVLAKIVETVLMAPDDVGMKADQLGTAVRAGQPGTAQDALDEFLRAAKLDLNGHS
jgi:hypothetical protein